MENNAEIFNEESLRKEIVSVWGEYGAHTEVFDMVLKKVRILELLKTGGYITPGKLEEAAELLSQLKTENK